MTDYKNAVCRGCYYLGTACGKCEKCLEEQLKIGKLAQEAAHSELDRLEKLAAVRIPELKAQNEKLVCELDHYICKSKNLEQKVKELEGELKYMNRAIAAAQRQENKMRECLDIALANNTK